MSLGPGGKSGGEGKADGDGAVDIDDLACEVTQERLSSRLECELGEWKKPKVGDRYDGEGSMAPSMESDRGWPSVGIES